MGEKSDAAGPQAFEVLDGPRNDEQGLVSWTVASPFQRGANTIQVLLPDEATDAARRRVVYVLPVNPGVSGKWGSGIVEARRLGLHNRHGVIFVSPAFDAWPWYADHPTDPALRQESYMTEVVVPFVEGHYAVDAAPTGRLLVGFSKSGWGAFHLLLRRPDVFGRAAAWDAPFSWPWPPEWPGRTGEGYSIAARLDERAEVLKRGPARLAVLGYDYFQPDGERLHERMSALGVPHHYANDTKRPHHWSGGWLEEAVAFVTRSEST